MASRSKSPKPTAKKVTEDKKVPSKTEFDYKATQVKATAAYCLVNIVNGGISAAFSAALLPLARSLGSTAEKLGVAVSACKVGKLLATFAFMGYGEKLKKKDGVPSPHIAMAVMVVTLAIVSAILSRLTSVAAVSAAMFVIGFSYGFTDGACSAFLLWVWQDNPVGCRTSVSLCATIYCVGCLLAPLMIATSLSYSGILDPAFIIWSTTALATGAMLGSTVSPPQPKNLEDKDKKDTSSSSGMGSTEGLAFKFQAFASFALFLMVGVEHGFGVWVANYGSKMHKMSDSAAAIVTSAYWTSLMIGRLINTALSTLGLNPWGTLIFLVGMCLGGGLLLLLHTSATLWFAAVAIGLGVSAIFPVAFTLPSSYKVVLTTRQTTTISLIFNCGEAMYPYVAGELMGVFGPMALEWIIIVSSTICLVATCAFWAHISAVTSAEKKTS